ncbi:MAG: hypothetical protein ABH879_05310 [archaeon]
MVHRGMLAGLAGIVILGAGYYAKVQIGNMQDAKQVAAFEALRLDGLQVLPDNSNVQLHTGSDGGAYRTVDGYLDGLLSTFADVSLDSAFVRNQQTRGWDRLVSEAQAKQGEEGIVISDEAMSALRNTHRRNEENYPQGYQRDN